jgi:acyl-CoA thioester hydrolase
MKHQFKQRIIYKDTDAEGVAYYAHYLEYFEQGRMELLRSLGISLKDLKEKHNKAFTVTRVECDYSSPAYFDDEIIIKTEVDSVSGARVVFKQEAVKDDRILVLAIITTCAISLKTFKPTRLPQELTALLK